jgi:hypothetical protein
MFLPIERRPIMNDEILQSQGQGTRLATTIVIGVIALACVAGLVAAVIVVAGEIPWHHIFACGCG